MSSPVWLIHPVKDFFQFFRPRFHHPVAVSESQFLPSLFQSHPLPDPGIVHQDVQIGMIPGDPVEQILPSG